MSILADIRNLDKHFDGIKALDQFDCVVGENAILGLLGPNGAGKTTLFNVITGFLQPDSGNVTYKGTKLVGCHPPAIFDLGIARTFQELRLVRRLTVLENILLCFKNQSGEKLTNVFLRPDLCFRQETKNRNKALLLLESTGIADEADKLADTLSYGQQKLLSLACCLASDATMLLLDEPVAGIAPQMAEKILKIIADLPNHGKSAIVIEHDIDALKSIAHRMIFMDAGCKVCEGTPSAVLSDPRVIEAYLD